MNRIEARLSTGKPALIVYLTIGDPSLDETADLVLACERGGADIVELGVPFSDPFADGPVIQRAMERALSNGAQPNTLGKSFEVVRAVRQKSQVPLVLFGYFNPLLQHGLARTAKEAAAAGVDGMLVVDLPPEESDDLDAELAKSGVCRIPLIAPTSSPARAKTIAARGSGFAYYVALAGVTGAGNLDTKEVERRVAELRPAIGKLPLAVGFGVRTAEDAAKISTVANGVVVGSALVKTIADAPDKSSRLTRATELCRTLKSKFA